jgi:hypothetical protein
VGDAGPSRGGSVVGVGGGGGAALLGWSEASTSACGGFRQAPTQKGGGGGEPEKAAIKAPQMNAPVQCAVLASCSTPKKLPGFPGFPGPPGSSRAGALTALPIRRPPIFLVRCAQQASTKDQARWHLQHAA